MKKNRFFRKPIGLRIHVTLLICAVLAISLIMTYQLVSIRVTDYTRSTIEEKAKTISTILSESPLVKGALSGNQPVEKVQTYVESIRTSIDVDFIVVLDMNGIRLSHPNPALIGQHFVGGDDQRVYEGYEYASTAEGTLGVSLRYFSPIYNDQDVQIGAVAVGIMLTDIEEMLYNTRWMIFISILFSFVLGIPGAVILAERIKKILFGLEPHEISKLFEERNAMLHSVREGILGVDRDLNITIVNEEAARIFEQAGIDRDIIGKNAELAIPNSNLRSVIETGQSEYDQEQEINGIHILTNRVAIRVNGNIVGAVATFRDKTYILKMAEDLTGVKLYADALRSQTHEFLNRLHVILGMIHMGHYDRLSDYIHEISDKFQDEAGSLMQHIKDPVLAGFIMAKLSHARECGVFLSLSDETFVPELGNIDLENDLTTLIGNLLENAMEAVVSTDHKDIELCMTYHDDLLSIVVRDSGEGIPSSQSDAVFKKGYSTRGENRGYGMYHIKQILEKYQGNMEISSIPIEGTEIFVTLPLKRGV